MPTSEGRREADDEHGGNAYGGGVKCRIKALSVVVLCAPKARFSSKSGFSRGWGATSGGTSSRHSLRKEWYWCPRERHRGHSWEVSTHGTTENCLL